MHIYVMEKENPVMPHVIIHDTPLSKGVLVVLERDDRTPSDERGFPYRGPSDVIFRVRSYKDRRGNLRFYIECD